MPLDLGTSLLELGLAVSPTATGGLDLRVDVDVDLFDPDTARSLVRQVRAVLVAAVDGPGPTSR